VTDRRTEATFCRVALVLDTLRAPCCFVRDAFYDTLALFNLVPQIEPETRSLGQCTVLEGVMVFNRFHGSIGSQVVVSRVVWQS